MTKPPWYWPGKRHVVRYKSFQYRAGSWQKARRVVAKVEWHLGELFPRVGFIVTNLRWWSKNVVGFYNQRGTAEQWIKEGKNALKWTRLSCHPFMDNAVRLQLFALAYNLANFMRRLALPEQVKHWSLTTLRERLVKIGAKVVRHARYFVFQMTEVAVPREFFAAILERIPVSFSGSHMTWLRSLHAEAWCYAFADRQVVSAEARSDGESRWWPQKLRVEGYHADAARREKG
jgi:hypothetical protein